MSKPRSKQTLSREDVRELLEQKYTQFNRLGFIELDPISIPHRFSRRQDKEIAGFFAATLAWGQRKTIIRNCLQLMEWMDDAPYDFVRNHTENDLKRLLNFKHRTFQATDLLYFIHFFSWFYSSHTSLEQAFPVGAEDENIERSLIHFQRLFFSLPDYPRRTVKHVSTPERKSACKRLTMYLRWMVRTDDKGVDFGLWKTISPSQLICPCDVHVERVARRLRLIRRKQVDWETAVELTNNLRAFDPSDPVKYDFALFGLGVEEGFGR